MNASELLQMRLRAQLVHPHAPVTPGEVVRRMGAMQAQDLLGAKWAVGLRAGGCTDADVERALADKQMVRSWMMRGTLHFVAPEDLRWMLEVTAPKLFERVAARERQLQLSAEDFDRAGEAAVDGLQGGKALTRKEMFALFEAAGVSTDGQRGYHLLWHLAQQGLLCFGPMQGKQPTFVLLDEWVPPTEPLTREEALARFARRYFVGHGPATLKDFARWMGLPVGEARLGLQAIAGELRSESLDGTEYWFAVQDGDSDDAAYAGDAEWGVYLLPAFDEYVIGYGDREPIFEESHDDYHAQVASNGWFSPVIVAGGRVVGMWKRTVTVKEVVVTPKLVRRVDKTEKKLLAEAVERYGAFLGLPARLDT
ncbi:MAG TPA: winged helix DNA-binding domain-containing protein [Coriobacteriia bacterium]|nr:winged helix DNA-binding domain-containing protein [Coriobacteriia bacterium]